MFQLAEPQGKPPHYNVYIKKNMFSEYHHSIDIMTKSDPQNRQITGYKLIDKL